jgi:hypothetical protein
MKTLSKQSISLNISVTLGFGRRGILQHWHFLRISKKWSLPFREKIFPLFVQAMTEIGKTIYRSKLQLQQARLVHIQISTATGKTWFDKWQQDSSSGSLELMRYSLVLSLSMGMLQERLTKNLMTGEDALASWKIWDLNTVWNCEVAPGKTVYNDTNEVRIVQNYCLDMDITTNIIEEINDTSLNPSYYHLHIDVCFNNAQLTTYIWWKY